MLVSQIFFHERCLSSVLNNAFFLLYLLSAIPDPAPGVFLCAQKTFPYWMYTLWIPIIGFESLVLGLSASLGMKYYKTVRALANIQLDPDLKLDSLAYILLRDSITFPFMYVAQ